MPPRSSRPMGPSRPRAGPPAKSMPESSTEWPYSPKSLPSHTTVSRIFRSISTTFPSRHRCTATASAATPPPAPVPAPPANLGASLPGAESDQSRLEPIGGRFAVRRGAKPGRQHMVGDRGGRGGNNLPRFRSSLLDDLLLSRHGRFKRRQLGRELDRERADGERARCTWRPSLWS